MRILISNDDGIDAPGLKALVQVIASKHDVYVVAPDRERSATGHALTLHHPLRVEKMPDDFFPMARAAYAIDGTPTDCVKIALNKILDFKPDWVLSGINHGPNMGADILYSGTVSAAMEGAIYGIRSIAFSISEYRVDLFEEPASYIPTLLDRINTGALLLPPKTIFNVNIPVHTKVRGYALTRLGARMYNDSYDERQDPRGKNYYWLSGDLLESDNDPDSDVIKTREGFVSVTPVTFEMTNYHLIQEFQTLLDDTGTTSAKVIKTDKVQT
ncbi:MAG: 5'/3'-nucleotidase SurE [Candidatus Caenarcaniphilales bacterium]|nr:5'/3'-nucleotidase SurE [Candidatus Caenarcaniphilales bacterium]